MRGAVVLALAGLALVACSSGSAGSSSTTLRVVFWEDGTGTPEEVWRLRCDPARGTLPNASRACTRLAAGGRALFAPTPPDVACTELYGGPQRARVIGRVGGARVWVNLTRRNGCEISRWERLSPWLLPPGGVT